jgi:transposase InsO family protein
MKSRISITKKYKILQQYYEGVSAESLCHDYHIAHSTLYKWITDYPRENIIRAKLKKDDIIHLPRMISHTKKLEAEIDFLHRTVTDHMSLRERMKIIDNEYGKESLHVQCDALGINRTTYLNHKYYGKNEDAWFIKREAEYTEIIKKIYEDSGHVYGAKKIAAIMKKSGKPVSEHYVRRIMAKSGLISARSSTRKDHLIVARNMREAAQSSQNFKPNVPNQVWVSDVTVVCIHGHYYHICVFIDLFSRKVVGYNVGRNGSVQLIKKAFLKAFDDRQPKSLIIHTDNGAIYTSYSFNRALLERKVKHSYSRPGVPHDNAVAETFFNSLKRESLLRDDYPRSLRDLKDRVDIYMEWYNSKRLHEHLNYIAPDVYEEQYKTK